MKKLKEAVTVILIKDGKVLTVSRKTDHNDFGLIGGSVESFDFSLKAAAIREAKEETGLDIFNLQLVHACPMYGKMEYTYLAEFKGEVNFDKEAEPHVVKWQDWGVLLEGSFASYNERLLDVVRELELPIR